MIVPTPGISFASSVPVGVREQRERLVAVVLEVVNSSSAARWYDGPTANVLLLRTWHELQGVLVAPRFSGKAGNLEMRLPDATDSSLVTAIRSAAGGQERERIISASNAAGQRWGSRVIIGWIEGGVPVIDGYLVQPATPANRLAAVGGTSGLQDRGAAAAAESDIGGAGVARANRPPVSFQITSFPVSASLDPAEKEAYTAGYVAGYDAQWPSTQSMTIELSDKGLSDAEKMFNQGFWDGAKKAQADAINQGLP